MRGNPITHAIHAAEQLQSIWPGTAPIVVIDRLISQLGIRVEFATLPQRVSGFAWPFVSADGKTSYPVITINRTHTETRQLFSLAHELYHCLAGHCGGLSYAGARHNYRPEELAANRFAADLLMPAARVRQIVLETNGGPATVAREFQVSIEAATYRINEVLGTSSPKRKKPATR